MPLAFFSLEGLVTELAHVLRPFCFTGANLCLSALGALERDQSTQCYSGKEPSHMYNIRFTMHLAKTSIPDMTLHWL